MRIDVSSSVAIAFDSFMDYRVYFHGCHIFAPAYQRCNHISPTTGSYHKNFWILHHFERQILHPCRKFLSAFSAAVPRYYVGSSAAVDKDLCYKALATSASFNYVYSGKRV